MAFMADDAHTLRHETISRIIFLTKDYFINLFQGIYEKAVAEKRSNRYILKDFQLQIKQFCLSDVSYIDDQIKNTYQDIAGLIKVLEDISHVTFPLDFWKTCCLNMAREIWMKPYLFYENIPEQDYISNRIAAEKIVTNCLKTFLRQTAVINPDNVNKETESEELVKEKPINPDEIDNVVTLTNENPSTCDMTCFSTEDKQVICDLACTDEKTVIIPPLTHDDKISTDGETDDDTNENSSDESDDSEYDTESVASKASKTSSIQKPTPDANVVKIDKTNPLNTQKPKTEKPEEKLIILDTNPSNNMEKKYTKSREDFSESDSDSDTPIVKPDSMTRYKGYYNPENTKKRVGSFRLNRNRFYRSHKD